MLVFLRKDLILILSIVALFLSVSYAIGYISKNNSSTAEVQTNFLGGESALATQKAAGRVWQEPAFERLLTLNPTALTKPTLMRGDDAGNIYILDWADFRIKMFSPDGNLLKVFGEGKGEGASAFANPTGFSVSDEGDVWVCDPPQRKITRFRSGERAQTIEPQREAWRVATVGDALITMAVPERNALFEIYNLSGNYSKSFGELIENQPEAGIVLDGNIIGDADTQGFIYGGRHLGVLAGYSVGGERRFMVHTIDSLPPPKILNIGVSQKVKPNSPRAVLSMNILGNELYVLSGVRDEQAKSAGGRVVDVYDKRNGQYMFSFKLPVACQEVVVQEERIYMLGGEGVTVWRFKH